MQEISTRPYLVRALFEWCNDSGYTPYLSVAVTEAVTVPQEYVKDGEIVLNISPLATNRLVIGNEFLEFQARFGGVAREVRVPIDCIRAIYARETGAGMAFEAPSEPVAQAPAAEAAPAEPTAPVAAPQPLRPLQVVTDPPQDPPPPPAGPGERPRLTRIK